MFVVKRIAQTAKEIITPPGQVVFTTVGTTNWTVPPGVKSISMVAVQAGTDFSTGSSVTVNGVVVCRAKNDDRIGDGGGDGGIGGGYVYVPNYYFGGGGGGAGGYSGNGGSGEIYVTASAGNGQGGGGGGGAHGSGGGADAGGGGGVGLLGQGANGTASNGWGKRGGGGSGGEGGGYSPIGGLYGGGHGRGPTSNGTRGGALSYKNNVAVTPGQTVIINIAAGTSGGLTNNGAVRIIWGPGRAYPSTNTGNV